MTKVGLVEDGGQVFHIGIIVNGGWQFTMKGDVKHVCWIKCCVINIGYTLKAALECVLWTGFLQKIDCTILHELQLPLYCLILFFFEFSEVIVEYFVYKRVFGFHPFCFYYLFMKLFLFQSKTKNAVKDINQNFTSSKLNEKKSERPFCKKTHLWTIGFVWFRLKFLWEVGAPESSNCFLLTVLRGGIN